MARCRSARPACPGTLRGPSDRSASLSTWDDAARIKGPNMLINCVAYQDGHKLADIPVDDIDVWVGKPGCFVWVALLNATDEELRQMQEEFGLHELAVEDARHGHQRPKIEEYGETLFVVMKLPEVRGDEFENGEVAIFVGPQLRAVGAQPQRPWLPGRARALRARARASQARRRLRPLCADGRRRRSLLPAARHDGDRSGGHRGADLRVRVRRARTSSGCMR